MICIILASVIDARRIVRYANIARQFDTEQHRIGNGEGGGEKRASAPRYTFASFKGKQAFTAALVLQTSRTNFFYRFMSAVRLRSTRFFFRASYTAPGSSAVVPVNRRILCQAAVDRGMPLPS